MPKRKTKPRQKTTDSCQVTKALMTAINEKKSIIILKIIIYSGHQGDADLCDGARFRCQRRAYYCRCD